MSGKQHNEFLRQFLEMRKQHKAAPAQAPESTTTKGKMKARGKTAAPIEGEMAGVTVAKIIEDKPNKKTVCEYFQQLADRLTSEKMK